MKLTEHQADVIAESVENAYYWLSRDGKHTSPTMWTDMMAKLERAHRVINRVKERASRKAAVIAAVFAVCGFGALRAAEIPRIDYGALYAAIAAVESDDGRTSRNVYQITRRYWDDVNRFTGWRWDRSSYPDMAEVRVVAQDYMTAYFDYYGDRYQRRTGKPITAEVLAKMHRVGFEGLWKRPETAERYWRRVKRVYDQKINRR